MEHSRHTSNSSYEESIKTFKLLLEIMKPAEFAILLQARVRHLLKTWPPQPPFPIGEPASPSEANSDSFSPSFESIRAFTSFFRTQDSPDTSPLDAPNDNTSLIVLHHHLLATQTSLERLSGRDLVDLVRARLRDGGKERSLAVQGLIDVMRNTSSDDSEQKAESSGIKEASFEDRSVLNHMEPSKGPDEQMEISAPPSVPPSASTSKRKALSEDENPGNTTLLTHKKRQRLEKSNLQKVESPVNFSFIYHIIVRLAEVFYFISFRFFKKIANWTS
jgi:hypothetical protein